MNRWKGIFWISSALLAVLALAGSLAPAAIAQIRAAVVREVDSPIRGVRFIERINGSFAVNQFSANGSLAPVVPAGKRLFLQRLTIETILSDNQTPQSATLTLSQAASGTGIEIDERFQGAGTTQRHYAGNQDLDILLNPGESLNMNVFRNDNLGSSSLNFFNVTVIGYFVDAS